MVHGTVSHTHYHAHYHIVVHSTGTGIKYFKSGQTKKANEFFDFALSVDHSNVECLVARGAL